MERDQASKFMFDLLRLMTSKRGSDQLRRSAAQR
jgi:hypothetical protein